MTRSSLVPNRRLPEQPNLDHLRKQAKELLQDFLSGNPAAIEEVRRHERNPNPEDFRLNDAQRVLARSYGFASWPKLKAFVDGVNVKRFMDAVRRGDLAEVRRMLASRPELVGMDTAENDEHRAIHHAVLNRDVAMTRLLMEAGADARKGIWPHRDGTTAWALAHDREYSDVVAVIEEEERHRREDLSCINATVSPRQDQISSAIARGETEKAVNLIEEDLSQIHACDRSGRTPLHVAAQRQNVDLVRWLIDNRANVRKVDAQGWTPLDLAARSCDPRTDDARTFPEIATMLRQHGAAMTIDAAVALGDEDFVREAVQAQPELLRRIDHNGGLLKIAVLHHQLGVARLLLDLGADVDERIVLEQVEEPTASWGMPLWNAALAGDYEMSKLLLDRGADPNANVYASGWPLRNAWDHDDPSVKNLLLERGAKIQPYMIPEMNDLEATRRLLAEQPSEEVISELAWSAADHGCPEILELALPHLSWPSTDHRWHWVLLQPIRGASSEPGVIERYFRCMEAILKAGVNPDLARYGQTMLHFTAARSSDLAGAHRAHFASLLLDYGADVTLRDDLLKSTPLGWACRWGRVEMVRELLRRGAPVDEPDAEPWATPISWAKKMGHEAILKLLLDKRA